MISLVVHVVYQTKEWTIVKRKKDKKFVLFSAFISFGYFRIEIQKKLLFQMSENEDLESLKVTELQNELKKRGLETKGRKAELITRLREAINSGVEGNNYYLFVLIHLSFLS
jgi:hypothetical protein